MLSPVAHCGSFSPLVPDGRPPPTHAGRSQAVLVGPGQAVVAQAEGAEGLGRPVQRLVGRPLPPGENPNVL